ncbi:MAG: acetyl-CoA carboxylase biotin carboxyl carrier protein [Chthonomonadales bacterium]|nr:acetyl-CoA carboxylase biotin carboxyl carrier protein [Chthonomonadales bacterium]
MTDSGIELDHIVRLIRLVETRGLAELIVEDGDWTVRIRGAAYRPRRARLAQAPAEPAAQAGAGPSGTPTPAEPAPEPEGNGRTAIEAPMVGIFFRSASPDDPPFVEVGDRVEVGQTIGLIEAMKVFSEIPSDYAGVVAAIAAANGQLVKEGEPLVYLSAAET